MVISLRPLMLALLVISASLAITSLPGRKLASEQPFCLKTRLNVRLTSFAKLPDARLASWRVAAAIGRLPSDASRYRLTGEIAQTPFTYRVAIAGILAEIAATSLTGDAFAFELDIAADSVGVMGEMAKAATFAIALNEFVAIILRRTFCGEIAVLADIMVASDPAATSAGAF